jgi:hypothetical protein
VMPMPLFGAAFEAFFGEVFFLFFVCFFAIAF